MSKERLGCLGNFHSSAIHCYTEWLFFVLCFFFVCVLGFQGVDVDEKTSKKEAAKLFGANTPTVSCNFSSE